MLIFMEGEYYFRERWWTWDHNDFGPINNFFFLFRW